MAQICTVHTYIVFQKPFTKMSPPFSCPVKRPIILIFAGGRDQMFTAPLIWLRSVSMNWIKKIKYHKRNWYSMGVFKNLHWRKIISYWSSPLWEKFTENDATCIGCPAYFYLSIFYRKCCNLSWLSCWQPPAQFSPSASTLGGRSGSTTAHAPTP